MILFYDSKPAPCLLGLFLLELVKACHNAPPPPGDIMNLPCGWERVQCD